MSASATAADLVIGLDSSTQSTKAIVWDRGGRGPGATPLAEGRAAIPLSTPAPGRAEQDVEDWWRAAVTALSQSLAGIDPGRIAALAISNQRETVALLDAEGRAVSPALVWLDGRAASELAPVAEALGGDEIHRITGKPLDVTPVLYRLAWLKRHAPEVLDRSARILDVQGFLAWRLTGALATGWTSADPFGLFDIEAKCWSPPILDFLGLGPDRLAPAVAPGSEIGRITEDAAKATGLRAGTPLFAAGGDGQCAGLGVDAVRPGRVYLNLGTAIIAGLWSATPAIDRHWRSMTSPTGEGYFLESVQRAGAYFVKWFVETLADGGERVFADLEAAAADLPIGSDGLLLSPYLAGCMDPHWDPLARGAFVGLSGTHGRGHLYRAALEGLTLEAARALEVMRARGVDPREIVAIGGGAKSPLWLRMVADATGLPVRTGRSVEASALGAGMTAAVGAGLFESFDTAAAAMSDVSTQIDPNPEVAARYADLSALQGRVYDANAALYRDLARFRAGD